MRSPTLLPHRLVLAVSLLLPGSTLSVAAPPAVNVSGPIPGDPSFNHGQFDLTQQGYVKEEFFLSGTATSYKSASGPLSNDGRWTVQPSSTAPYTTRLIVIRPINPRKFNGTALVEWLNVTGGQDLPAEWRYLHRHLLREGFAYVGVSVQRASMEPGPRPPGAPGDAQPLKVANPSRYSTLQHPGDAYSFDIFSQAGFAIRGAGATRVLGNLAVKQLLGAGMSQSATFLPTYINALDGIAKVFDGYLVHARFAFAANLEAIVVPAAPGAPAANPVQIRSDVRVPVLTFESETDVTSFQQARQPDTARFRAWEVAGTAHSDSYLAASLVDVPSLPVAELARYYKEPPLPGVRLAIPANSAPQHHYVYQAALHHLNRWVTRGTLPPASLQLELDSPFPPRFALDSHGNVRGGIRTPWVDVPLAKLSGIGTPGSLLSLLLGTTQAFDAATIRTLYPGGKAEYLAKFSEALKKSVRAGYILKADVKEIEALAAAMFP